MNYYELKHFVGMRAIKTAIAVCLGMYLAMLFKIHYPVFVAIAAITSMQPTFAESFQSIWNRAFTAVLGVILGTSFAYLFPGPYLRPIAGGVGILIIIKLLLILKAEKSISLSTIVFMACLATTAKSTLVYGLDRIYGTLLGVAVGFLVNLLIFTPNTHGNFIKDAESIYKNIKDLYLNHIINGRPDDVHKFDSKINHLKQMHGHMKSESNHFFMPKIDLKRCDKINDLLLELDLRMKILWEYGNDGKIDIKNVEKISRIYKYSIFDHTMRSNNEPDLVYNYQLSMALDSMEEVYRLIKKEEETAYDRKKFGHS